MGTDFEAWLTENASAGRVAKYAWEGWPEDVRAEVDRVIEMHREGRKRIALATMCRRLIEHHQVRASETMLRRYAETVHRSRWNGEAIR